jgi:hypothetical protein
MKTLRADARTFGWNINEGTKVSHKGYFYQGTANPPTKELRLSKDRKWKLPKKDMDFGHSPKYRLHGARCELEGIQQVYADHKQIAKDMRADKKRKDGSAFVAVIWPGREDEVSRQGKTPKQAVERAGKVYGMTHVGQLDATDYRVSNTRTGDVIPRHIWKV